MSVWYNGITAGWGKIQIMFHDYLHFTFSTQAAPRRRCGSDPRRGHQDINRSDASFPQRSARADLSIKHKSLVVISRSGSTPGWGTKPFLFNTFNII